MANKYKYMFIDAQICLVTGMYAVMHQFKDRRINEQTLLKMFIQSMFKLTREVKCDRPYLLWDSAPYHKQTILKEALGKEDYKGDRGYKTADEVTILKEKLGPLQVQLKNAEEHPELYSEDELAALKENLTKEITKIERSIDDIEVQIHNFQVRGAVKRKIIDTLGDFGYTSIIMGGYEADDIAQLLVDYCTERKEKVLLVSKDSDWDYMLTPYADKYDHYTKNAAVAKDPSLKWKTYESVKKELWWTERDFPGWKLSEIKRYQDSLYGSHNALKACLHPEWKKAGVFLKEVIDHLDEACSDKALFEAQMKTSDFTLYPKYEFMKKCLPWYSKKGHLKSVDEFVKYAKENKLALNPYSYLDIIKILDYELFDVPEQTDNF